MSHKMKKLCAVVLATLMLGSSVYASSDIWWPVAASAEEEECTITFRKMCIRDSHRERPILT